MASTDTFLPAHKRLRIKRTAFDSMELLFIAAHPSIKIRSLEMDIL
jgi:hypothetical protein